MLCVSYQKLNQVTRTFTFHITRFDDGVQDIETEANYFISVDMDSGYWQLVVEEEAQERLSFFAPDEKKAVESDAYGGPKFSSNICSNDNEATQRMGQTSPKTRFKNFA